MRVLPMGQNAALVADLDGDLAAWASALRARAVEGLREVVPAAETVLIVCESSDALARVIPLLPTVKQGISTALQPPEVEIGVRFDGPDLEEVATAAGWTADGVATALTEAHLEVAFCGFAPGFAYLTGVPAELHLARRATPRTLVPAGSVAIAAGYAAIYPRASPGGWHLLGSTDAVLFDVDRDPPTRLVPGARVRLVEA